MKKETEDHRISSFFDESHFPWWEWNVPDNEVKANRKKVEMLGYRHENFVDKGYQAYTELLHPDDYERTMHAMRDLLEGRAELYQVDYRIKAADGTYHWYMDRGSIIERLPDGSPAIVRGLVIDLGVHISTDRPVEKLIALLRTALHGDRTGERLITVCSNCRRLKSENEWLEISKVLYKFISAKKSHGLCEDCLRRLYPRIAERVIEKLRIL